MPRKGPLIIKTAEPREQLQQYGSVFTLRERERTTGETHVRFSMTGSKEFDVRVTEIGEVNPRREFDLSPYVDSSGYDSVEEWQKAVHELTGNLPSESYVYQVTALDDAHGDHADTDARDDHVVATDGGL